MNYTLIYGFSNKYTYLYILGIRQAKARDTRSRVSR